MKARAWLRLRRRRLASSTMICASIRAMWMCATTSTNCRGLSRVASCGNTGSSMFSEHLHLMPEQWLRGCYRLLAPGSTAQARVPIFGTPWHLIDPTHVRGFHPLNFDYFIRGRELHQKYGHYYFDFAFANGQVEVEGYNIKATLLK